MSFFSIVPTLVEWWKGLQGFQFRASLFSLIKDFSLHHKMKKHLHYIFVCFVFRSQSGQRRSAVVFSVRSQKRVSTRPVSTWHRARFWFLVCMGRCLARRRPATFDAATATKAGQTKTSNIRWLSRHERPETGTSELRRGAQGVESGGVGETARESGWRVSE
jgi:hypothetical protein